MNPSCPECGNTFTSLRTADTAPTLQPNDHAVCAHCATILVVTTHGALRPLTEAEELALPVGLMAALEAGVQVAKGVVA